MDTLPLQLKIGVLALQGGFAEHENHLLKAAKEAMTVVSFKLTTVQVRVVGDLNDLDGIILPGGESTAMSVFLEKDDFALFKALKEFTATKPTWGTCAGLILLSNSVEGQMKDGQQLV